MSLITLPPTTQPGRTVPELKQALDVWTKQAHAAMKQLNDAISSQAGTIKTQVVKEVTETVLKTGDLTEKDSNVLNINNGIGVVVGDGTSIQVKQASAVQDGFLSKFDWNVFNTRSGTVTTGNLTESTSAVLTITGGTNAVVGSGTTVQVKQANTTTSGFLSSTDWNTFNGKAAAFTTGNLTESTSAVLTITGGTGAIIGSGLTIRVKQAGASQSGYLSSTDWNTFNTTVTGCLPLAGGTMTGQILFSGVASPINFGNGMFLAQSSFGPSSTVLQLVTRSGANQAWEVIDTGSQADFYVPNGKISITSGLGGYQVNGVQVVGVRQPSWGAASGPFSRAAFSGSVLSVATISQTLAALIADLTQHGLIGP